MRIFILFLFLAFACTQTTESVNNNSNAVLQHPKLLIHEVDVKENELHFYYKNEFLENFSNHKRLKEHLRNKSYELLFAVNGGMYKKNFTPQGLFIEKGKIINAIETKIEGYGNFYLQPNGIFYIDKNGLAGIKETTKVSAISNLKYATQSGPMLVINGEIHPEFRERSTNLHIRNGVGILPNGNLLFVMSKEKINFHELAMYFKNNKCSNALYLDGFVSRTYLPSKNWIQEDGNFGIIIGEVKRI